MNKIVSMQNGKIKQACQLKSQKERKKSGLFLVEGKKAMEEIPLDWPVEHFFVSEELGYIKTLEARAPVYCVTEPMLQRIGTTESSQGMIAVCHQGNHEVSQIDLRKENQSFLLLENVQDPGNLGTMIRTADGFCFDAVFLSPGCADLYNPKVLRSTMGSLFHIPIVSQINTEVLLQEMKKNKVQILAASLQAETFLREISFESKLLWIIGNEGNGITEETLQFADKQVKIPMPGKAESLNASIAAGIVLYETSQRK